MDSAQWWYYTQQNGAYYPQVVANAGFSVWDWDASRQTSIINGVETQLLWQEAEKSNKADANSDPVGAWVDGVSGVDATQATSANKPTYTTNSLNGKPTLNVVNDYLTTGNITLNTFAIWVVFRASNGGIVYDIGEVNTGDGARLLGTTNTTLAVRKGVNRSRKDYTLNWSADNTWRVARHEFNGTHASQTLTLNGALISLSDINTDNPGTGDITQVLRFALRTDGFSQLIGDIAHVCIVSPYPTSAIITQMESYINQKWAVY